MQLEKHYSEASTVFILVKIFILVGNVAIIVHYKADIKNLHNRLVLGKPSCFIEA